ncbi:MAG: VF530 family DNA-binding protein [Gammaproteobacteria bacterium]|nr:MAG: VF530 family DNA-binding protein [Gammaproteobacteria bacterium]
MPVNDEINYKTNPLHGVGLKTLLTEIVDHYGFEILFAYLNINCFKTRASVDSSLKFLKKTDWAREKVEAFYMYEYKNLPRASDEQFELSPRDRIVPAGQTPGEPADLSLEDAEQLREKRARRTASYDSASGQHFGNENNERESSSSSSRHVSSSVDPWANWKK